MREKILKPLGPGDPTFSDGLPSSHLPKLWCVPKATVWQVLGDFGYYGITPWDGMW